MKTIARRIRKIFGIALLTLANVPTVLAAEAKPAKIPCTEFLPCVNKESGQEIRDFIINVFASNFTKGFLGLIATTSVIFIIVGGAQMHLALGNEEALGKAKKTVIWAIAGLVISLLAVVGVQIVVNLATEL